MTNEHEAELKEIFDRGEHAKRWPLGENQWFTNQNVPTPPREGWRAGHGFAPVVVASIEMHEDVRYRFSDVMRFVDNQSPKQVITTLMRGICQSSIEEIRALYEKGME